MPDIPDAPQMPALGDKTGPATQYYMEYQEALGIWKLFVSMVQSLMQAQMDAAAGSKDATKAFRISG